MAALSPSARWRTVAEFGASWAPIAGAGVGVGALAGAAQLGLAYGLGLLHFWLPVGPALSGGVWASQLTWVAWFAALATLAGAAAGAWLALRQDDELTLGTRIGAAAAGAVGAAITLPLTGLPARGVLLVGVGPGSNEPVIDVLAAAGLGVLLGGVAAIAVLSIRLVAVSVTLLIAAVWLLALVSVLPSLAGDDLPDVRLAVLDLPGLGGARSVVAVLSAPVLALLVCGAVAAAARSRGFPPLLTAASSAAAPGLLALTYLIGSPGTTDRAAQVSAYAGSLIALAAGLLAALLVGGVRLSAQTDGPGSPDAGGEPGRWPVDPSSPAGAQETPEPGGAAESSSWFSGDLGLSQPDEPSRYPVDRPEPDSPGKPEPDLFGTSAPLGESDPDPYGKPTTSDLFGSSGTSDLFGKSDPASSDRFAQPAESKPAAPDPFPWSTPSSRPEPASPSSTDRFDQSDRLTSDRFDKSDRLTSDRFGGSDRPTSDLFGAPDSAATPKPAPFPQSDPASTAELPKPDLTREAVPAPPDPFADWSVPATESKPAPAAEPEPAPAAGSEPASAGTEPLATTAEFAAVPVEEKPAKRLRLPKLRRKSKPPEETAAPEPVSEVEPSPAWEPEPPTAAAEPAATEPTSPAPAAPEPSSPAPAPRPAGDLPRPKRRSEVEHLDWISSLADRSEDDEQPEKGARRRLRRDRDLGSLSDLPELPDLPIPGREPSDPDHRSRRS
ncbi:MAG TPA: hypothetical protein VIL37_14770 [Natronosporangium sp.]